MASFLCAAENDSVLSGHPNWFVFYVGGRN